MTLLASLAIAFTLVLAMVSLYAAVCGDGPEIVGGAVNFGAALLTAGVQLAQGRRWADFDPAIVAIDAGVGAAFLLLAVRSTRFWPIWCFAFALDDVFVQLARLVTPDIEAIAYGSAAATIWAYLALLALTLGTWRATRARRQSIGRKSWVENPPPGSIWSIWWSEYRARTSNGWRRL